MDDVSSSVLFWLLNFVLHFPSDLYFEGTAPYQLMHVAPELEVAFLPKSLLVYFVLVWYLSKLGVTFSLSCWKDRFVGKKGNNSEEVICQAAMGQENLFIASSTKQNLKLRNPYTFNISTNLQNSKPSKLNFSNSLTLFISKSKDALRPTNETNQEGLGPRLPSF